MAKYIEPKVAEIVDYIAAEVVDQTQAEIRAAIKLHKIRSFKKADQYIIEHTQVKPEVKPEVKTKKTPTQRKLRGYTFGKVWNAAVLAGDKLATHPCNAKKLAAQAESFGINAALYEQAELAEKVAAHLHYTQVA